MKTQLTSIILFILTISIYSQDIKTPKPSKTEIKITTAIGSATTIYGFVSDKPMEEKIKICVSGVLFAAIPIIFDNIKSERITINQTGINIKLKYRKFKCKKLPYKPYKNF